MQNNFSTTTITRPNAGAFMSPSWPNAEQVEFPQQQKQDVSSAMTNEIFFCIDMSKGQRAKSEMPICERS